MKSQKPYILSCLITFLLLSTYSTTPKANEWTPERKKSSVETCLKSAVKARINIELSKGNITKEMLSDPNAKQEIYTNVENFFRPYCQCVVDKTSSDFPVYDQKPARQAQDPKYGKQLQAHCIKAIHANNNATAK